MLVVIIGIFLMILPMIAGAEANGTCGDNLTWTLDDNGTLTISGKGKMQDLNAGDAWTNSARNIRSVVIVNGVTSIGGT